MPHAPLDNYAPDWPPELRIAPARPLATSDRDGSMLAELDPGKGGQTIVQPLTDFKRRLDLALIATAAGAAIHRPWLERQGFVKPPTGTGVEGDALMSWLFGPFWRVDPAESLCRVPAWMCVGWNRRQYGPMTPLAAAELSASLDDETRRNASPGRAVGYWFAPFPLVLMGEGKHRVDLHVQHELSMLIQLRVATIAPAASLRLQRVLGSSEVVALHCTDATFAPAGRSTALLPLPDLALPFLEAYGVRWSGGRHLLSPRSPALLGDPQHRYAGLSAWVPRHWRPMILAQSYV